MSSLLRERASYQGFKLTTASRTLFSVIRMPRPRQAMPEWNVKARVIWDTSTAPTLVLWRVTDIIHDVPYTAVRMGKGK